ncbi:MAG: tRNA lysidine(34) synthetase TilS [Chloroflexi bacterium]|nr:tRNA lysidine(34) synthetase TilS [Chloroflexota bacterium]
MAMHFLERQVSEAVKRAGFSNTGTTLVVGASGGPDSTALLHALVAVKDIHGLALHVGHLHHNFRGKEADDDAVFAEDLAHSLGLPATVAREDPHEYQRIHGISSFEQGAREMRYAFLARIARDAHAGVVTVGHTADDLAETVMLHVIRGSGMHGLRGMTELSDWPWPKDGAGLALFRPLLGVTKDQTVAYVRGLGQTFREDSGNFMWRFTRNKVRHDLMPKLAADYNPQVRQALVRLAHAAAEELDFAEGELNRVWPGVAVESDGEVRFSQASLGGLHPHLQRLALRRGYILVNGDSTRLAESHLISMVNLVQGERGGRTLNLPGGVTLRLKYGELTLTRGGEPDCPYPKLEGEYPIRVPAEAGAETSVLAGPWQVTMQITSAGEELDWAGDGWTVWLDPLTLGEDLSVRAWRPGDRIQPLGMRGQKKLQDLFTDLRVPRHWRGRVPLLENARGIAWVVGYRIADWAKVSGRIDESFLRITFSLTEDQPI